MSPVAAFVQSKNPMKHIHDWAARHRVSPFALLDLLDTLAAGMYGPQVAPPAEVSSEAGVTSLVRLEAKRKGVLLFRNQVGAMQDATGRVVRYGLANDSKAMNETLKSGDWIGIRPVLITDAHVGTVIGQFVSREIKRAGWKFTGSGREGAQANWANLITSKGGDAAFAAGEGSL